MGFNTANLDGAAYNELEISKDLPDETEITVEFLKSMANPKVISIYEVETPFAATDARHMSV